MTRNYLSLIAPLVSRGIGGEVVEHRQIVHASGIDRLTLRFRINALRWRLFSHNSYEMRQEGDTWVRLPSRGRAGDFHSLAWEHYDRGGWRKQAVITARRFRSSSAAWVSDIHSLDPGNGTAIIKIAEEIEMVPPIQIPQSLLAAVMGAEKFSRPVNKGFRVQYSWVSWDIRVNKKMEILSLCTNPNEPYGG